MRTIRRLYFYAVAFISLEVVLWGLIDLLRSIFNASIIGGSATRLAGSLALILVGLPVFWLHWRVARNDAHREMDEHASGLRAFFLYAVLLSTLIPAIQSFLAIVNRLFLDVNHLSRMAAFVGGQQTWSDNLIALLMNVLIASYFVTVLRADWKEITVTAPFTNVRQISRYLWVLYGLGLTVGGVQQILSFILQVPPTTFGLLLRADFINGLALTLVGTPLWVCAWKTVQDSLVEPVERDSLLRLGSALRPLAGRRHHRADLQRVGAVPAPAPGAGRRHFAAGLCPADQRTALHRHPAGGSVGLPRQLAGALDPRGARCASPLGDAPTVLLHPVGDRAGSRIHRTANAARLCRGCAPGRTVLGRHPAPEPDGCPLHPGGGTAALAADLEADAGRGALGG